MRIFTAKSMALTVALLFAAPAMAQSLDQHRANCYSSDPNTLDLQIAGCTAQIESGQWTGANLAIIFYNRGNAYKDKKDLTRAVADYDQAIRLNPQDSDAYNNRGNAYAAKQDLTRAIADYDQAIRLNPQNAGALGNRGSTYFENKDYGRALDDLNRALAIRPHRIDFDIRGHVRTERKEYRLAVADFDAAVKLAPENAHYRNGACWIRAAYLPEAWARARVECDAAVRLAPKEPAYLDSRGMVALKQGRFQDAWNDYDAAVRINPTRASWWYGRGIAALRLGRNSKGKADIAKALALNPKISETYSEYGVRP